MRSQNVDRLKRMKIQLTGKLSRILSLEVDGQELVEYALLAGFIAVTVAAVIPYQVTGPIFNIFTKLGNYLVTVGNG